MSLLDNSDCQEYPNKENLKWQITFYGEILLLRNHHHKILMYFVLIMKI